MEHPPSSSPTWNYFQERSWAMVVISCHFMSCHVISCHFMSFHVISGHFMSFHVISTWEYHWRQLSKRCPVAPSTAGPKSATLGATHCPRLQDLGTWDEVSEDSIVRICQHHLNCSSVASLLGWDRTTKHKRSLWFCVYVYVMSLQLWITGPIPRHPQTTAVQLLMSHTWAPATCYN